MSTITLVTGKRGSGKTTLIADLIKKSQIPYTILYNTGANDYPWQTNAEIFMGSEIEALEKIDQIIKSQESLRENMKPIGLCIEDYFSHYKNIWDKITKISLKHYKISLIVCCQYVYFNSMFQSTIDYAYINKCSSPLDLIYKHFKIFFDSFDSFRNEFGQMTAYQFMFLNYDDLSHSIYEVKDSVKDSSVKDSGGFLNRISNLIF